ncbi:MAG: GGDEF domain-containing phosphodiesterase [Thalassovita sp.]|nr:GGDEF domain-containing phosphodiesterase [Thalassovita sp.]
MRNRSRAIQRIRRQLRAGLSGPQAIALFPAAVLGAFWFGGETWLLAVSLGVPVLYALAGGFSQARAYNPADAAPQLPDLLRYTLALARRKALRSGCFLLALDDFDDLIQQHGLGVAQRICDRLVQRLGSVLRAEDYVLRRQNGEFAVVLDPVHKFDLENAIQLAKRLQEAIAEPLPVDASSIYMTASIGFVLDRQIPGGDADTLIDAAEATLNVALASGPSAIRAYSGDMKTIHISHSDLARDAEAGLASGQFQPWFQPQVSTTTGQVTGVEALARWAHPRRGTIPPSEFLPLLKQNGLMERLGKVMLTRSLLALRKWDEAGVVVPRVGVNFSPEELRDPKLAEQIEGQLKRQKLIPQRLGVEVLETMVSTPPDDVIARNINALSEMGCVIDLDDFGTGHASLLSLRRFAVRRIKIDRAFAMKVDSDPEQQRIVVAILALADHLGLETLAEGVETAAEHAMLAQLGCDHVQGYGIARPMPFEQALDWIRANEAKHEYAMPIGYETGRASAKRRR